ncbi:MAG: glycine cleavage system aminomethyltransferase GcvT [Cyclobacteriaceae bacterium]|nr:glycine cleavage system aminomethyltransferase GcvT [Cyclobacteriaceae bacterium]
MKKTALYDRHIALGAKMVPFAGYEMPVRYASELEEHHAVRNSVGLFDVSHMGEFLVSGPNALQLIQKISANDATKLTIGRVQYSCMTNSTGGIVDDMLVYKIKPEEYMLVVNASNIEKDWDWINKNNDEGAELQNISDKVSLLAVQGPNALKLVQKLTSTDLSKLAYYTFSKGNIEDITDGVVLSATGYTGSGGVEIYVYNEYALAAWDKIMAAGQEFNIKPAGLGARDTLRLEMGYALYGNDIDDSTSPIEAGLAWITKFNKPFINAENLMLQKQAGPQKRLVGFVMEEKGIPRSGYEILHPDGEVIGAVTSGSMSPTLGYGIGMGYVQAKYAGLGTELLIAIRARKLKAKIVKLPFYQPKNL